MILKRVKFLWPHNPFKSIKFPNESNYSELHCTLSGCGSYFQADAVNVPTTVVVPFQKKILIFGNGLYVF